MKIPRSTIGIFCVLLLSACGSGGGGGDGAPAGGLGGVPGAAAEQSFPLRAAFTELYKAGLDKDFTVSGICTGTAKLTQAPANVDTTFELQPSFSAKQTQTLQLSNCPSPPPRNTTFYYDKAYAPLGDDRTSGFYSVFEKPQGVATSAPMPEFGKVGELGNVGTLTNYDDNNKAKVCCRTTRDFVIAGDPASSASAIVTVIESTRNGTVLTNTETYRYRVGLTGAATLLSIDSQIGTDPNNHLRLDSL